MSERVLWSPALSLQMKEFEFSAAEVVSIKAAIQTWDSYGVNADRHWLQSLWRSCSCLNRGPESSNRFAFI